MHFTYLNCLPPGLHHYAARLYLDALKDKIGPILGDSNRALRVLVRSLVPDHCLAALHDNEIVGMVGIQTIQSGVIDPAFNLVVREYD